jgi:RNA 2',3'-cyclic 3'-phosphodiesterase
MRIFIALDIDDEIRHRIALFLDGVRGFAPDARWVSAESLHVTVKFVGEKSEDDVEKIKQSLATITADAFALTFRGYGFFPSVRAPRVFWIGIEPEPKLTASAAFVDERLAQIAIAKEEHAFTPHLTLARGAGGSGSPRWHKGDSPNRSFQQLQEKLAVRPAPEFGTMTVRDLFLFQSQLSPSGSRYTKLAAFALR